MGCSSSLVVPSQTNSVYVPYKGHGNDYVNYSYYQNYFTESGTQEAWNDYKNLSQYQRSTDTDTYLGSVASTTDAYNQYKHWYDHRQQNSKEIRSNKLTPDGAQVDLLIDNSSTDVQSPDEPDCVADDPIRLRMGLKTIGTALRITIIKKEKECSYGPEQLKVAVLDTVSNRKPNAGFITRKPKVPSGQKYTDETFGSAKALGKYSSKYDWKRPHDIIKDKEICLFHEGTSLDDVDQGIFGTCYFLAVLGGLASQPAVMKQIILPDAYNIKLGVFHCRFWKVGQWVDIFIDDYLPCDSNGLVGCQSKNYAGEMWVPLMEKAYAKFMGSYPDIESGIPRNAYLALTGGCAEWLALTHYDYDSSAVYSRITNALRHSSVVVCGASPSSEEAKEKAGSLGLVTNHAYTLTATAIVERDKGIQESLVKLRNPWSHKEWTGSWGDKSAEWYTISQSQRAQLHEVEDDGEFWMSWTDFWSIFTDISVCSITPDYDFDGLSDGLDNVFCIFGAWSGKLTGGWENVEQNPTFEFTVAKSAKEPVNLLIECMPNLPAGVYKSSAGNVLLRDTKKKNQSDMFVGKDSLTYTTASPLTRRFDVRPGGKYQIIPTKYEAGEEGEFLLRVFSKMPLDIRPARRPKSRR